MVRRQFPIRLGSALTINKSQGQSFDSVGVYLTNSVFSHGQLYVALSRVTDTSNLKIHVSNLNILDTEILKRNNEIISNGIYVKNIVYSEVL